MTRLTRLHLLYFQTHRFKDPHPQTIITQYMTLRFHLTNTNPGTALGTTFSIEKCYPKMVLTSTRSNLRSLHLQWLVFVLLTRNTRYPFPRTYPQYPLWFQKLLTLSLLQMPQPYSNKYNGPSSVPNFLE